MADDLALAIVDAAKLLERREERKRMATIAATRKYVDHSYKLRFLLQGDADQPEEEFNSFSQVYNRALDLGYQQTENTNDDHHLISLINNVHKEFERSRQNFSEQAVMLLWKIRDEKNCKDKKKKKKRSSRDKKEARDEKSVKIEVEDTEMRM